MLTVISGEPGAGKTAYVVAQLDELLRSNPRPVYVMGIPELALDHQPVPPISDWTHRVPVPEDPNLEEAVFTFPDGALVIIDEAQKVFRPRGSTAKVPDYVSAFEKHRHLGLDFWLVTQYPTLIDSNVRRLAGQHIHLRSQWSGRTLYEWAEVVDPGSRSDRALATTRRYSLPKHVFGLYKSATVHIKPSKRLPLAVYVLAVAVLGVVVLGYRFFQTIDTAIEGGKPANPALVSSAPSPAASPALPPAPQAVSPSAVSGASMDDYKPRLRGRPETAPLYDEIRKPKVMPIVSGCVDMPTRGTCRCLTQQGTDAFLSVEECRAWIAQPSFNPWRAPAGPQDSPASSPAPASAASDSVTS